MADVLPSGFSPADLRQASDDWLLERISSEAELLYREAAELRSKRTELVPMDDSGATAYHQVRLEYLRGGVALSKVSLVAYIEELQSRGVLTPDDLL